MTQLYAILAGGGVLALGVLTVLVVIYRGRALAEQRTREAVEKALRVVSVTNEGLRNEIRAALGTILARQERERRTDATAAATAATAGPAGAATFLRDSAGRDRPAPALVPDGAGAGAPGPLERRPLPL